MHSSLDSAVVPDRGDSKSHPTNPTLSRSKRSKSLLQFEAEQMSASYAISIEDAASCLILLSKDKWKVKSTVDEFVDVEEEEEKEDCANGGCGSGFRAPVRTQGKYKCKTCDKVFPSYQALGGHRASHKKIIKSQVFDDREEEEDGKNGDLAVVGNHMTYGCSVCFKRFHTFQALGGHKRVHYKRQFDEQC